MLALKPELDRFLDRFTPLFGRDENRAHARRFVQGLLHGGERRNAEDIARAMGGGPVRTLQAFLTSGAWPDSPILAEMRRTVLEALADDDAVWNSDETGFPRKGIKSVGVKRQYSGTLGRADNCQVAVFANYGPSKGHTFMDRRPFLPEEWAGDRDRRDQAGVPPGVIFRTKPRPALEMMANAVAEGVPFRWVGGDGVYGDSPSFVQGVRLLGKWYVLDSSADARAWTAEPQVIPPEERPRPKRGRPCTQPLVVGEARRVDEVVAALPAAAWRRLTVAEGGPGAADLRARRGLGLVQRGGPARPPRASAGAEVLGPGAGVGVPPLQRPGGWAAAEAGPGACDALDDRGGYQVGQGTMRPG